MASHDLPLDNMQAISTSTSQSTLPPVGDTVPETGDFVGDFVDDTGGKTGVCVSAALGDSSNGAADGWSDDVGPVGNKTGGDTGDAGATDGAAVGSIDKMGRVGSLTGGITGNDVSSVPEDGADDGSSDEDGTERGTALPLDFGELTGTVGNDGTTAFDGAAEVAGDALPLDFGELTGAVTGVGAFGTNVLSGTAEKTGAALSFDFGDLTGTVIGGAGAIGTNVADGGVGPDGNNVLDGTALNLDFGDDTGDIGAVVVFDFGEGELVVGTAGDKLGEPGVGSVIGTVTGASVSSVVTGAAVVGANGVGTEIGAVTGASVSSGVTGAVGDGIVGATGDGTTLGEPGVGSVIGVETGASVSSGVAGVAVGAESVGAIGDGGNIEIWKLYSSESWHISPFGGVASAVTDAENSVATHVLILNDCTSDVPSPGLTGLISRSPSRLVVTPLNVISSFVIVISTVPTLFMLTIYSRVSKHEMESSSRSHDSTRNAPNSLVRLNGIDPDVSITLR